MNAGSRENDLSLIFQLFVATLIFFFGLLASN